MASNSTNLYSSNYPSSNPFTLTATLVENSYNQVTNTSNVTITATLASGGSYFAQYSTPTLGVQFKDNNANTTYTTKTSEQISSITSGTPSRSVTWTGDVAHKNDGTLTCYAKAVWTYKSSGTGYAPVSGEVEVSLAMTVIPREGTVSLDSSGIIIGTKNGSTVLTATVTPQNTSFYHRISASCNGSSVMTAVWAEDVSYTAGIIDTAILTALGNKSSDTVTVTVKTYATKSTSGTLIGTRTATATASVNTSAIKPSLTSVSMAVNTTPISSYMVAGYSTAKVNFTVAVGYGATSCTTTVTLSKGSMATSSATGTGAKTLNTKTVPASTADYTLTATIKATDGRGATATSTASITVKGYSKPTITAKAYRVASNGSTTADEAGTYVYVTYSATAKAIGSNSIQSLTATYTGSISGTVGSSPAWIALADNQGITITVTAVDKVDSIAVTRNVAVAVFPLDLYQNGGNVGAAIGGVAKSGSFDVYLPTNTTQNIVTTKTGTNGGYHRVANNDYAVELYLSNTGNRGIYNSTDGEWVLYADTNGNNHVVDQLRDIDEDATSAYTLSARSARMIRLTYNGAITVTIPDTLPEGSEYWIITSYLNARVTLNTSGSERLWVQGGTAVASTYTTTQSWTLIHLIKANSTRWAVST